MIDHLLQISEDMTGRLLNVFHDFASSNYSFSEDYVTQLERTENDQYYEAKHKTQIENKKGQENNFVLNKMSYEDINKLCTSTIVNSSIAVNCGPYYDQDIMNAIKICYDGKIYLNFRFNENCPLLCRKSNKRY